MASRPLTYPESPSTPPNSGGAASPATSAGSGGGASPMRVGVQRRSVRWAAARGLRILVPGLGGETGGGQLCRTDKISDRHEGGGGGEGRLSRQDHIHHPSAGRRCGASSGHSGSPPPRHQRDHHHQQQQQQQRHAGSPPAACTASAVGGGGGGGGLLSFVNDDCAELDSFTALGELARSRCDSASIDTNAATDPHATSISSCAGVTWRLRDVEGACGPGGDCCCIKAVLSEDEDEDGSSDKDDEVGTGVDDASFCGSLAASRRAVC